MKILTIVLLIVDSLHLLSGSMTYPVPTDKLSGKKILIISSHPNVGKSFNHKLIDAAKTALEAEGHAVIHNDLVAINFNPGKSVNFFAMRSLCLG